VTAVSRLAALSWEIEQLQPELRSHLVATSLGIGLQHPLTQQIPLFSAKLANEAYGWTKRAFDVAVEEKDWSKALVLMVRPFRLPQLADWWNDGAFSRGVLRKQLMWVWLDVELPSQHGVRVPLRLFRQAGFLSDALAIRRRSDLPEELVVYRGCQRKRYEPGLAWTRSPAIAAWFAHRLGDGYVLEALVPREGVLAVLLGRGEEEVVVEPRFLADVRRCERAVALRRPRG
jgi:hypothetical protein